MVILEVLETITDSQQRADLLARIPELRNIMCEHLEDNHSNAKLRATTMGKGHNLAKGKVEQHLRLKDTVNGTSRQAKETVMDTKEDWKKYRNTSTDHEVASGNNLTHVQLAQDSTAQPQEVTAVQAVPCITANKCQTPHETAGSQAG